MIGKALFALIDAIFGVAMAADETARRAKKLSRVLRKRPAPDAAPTTQRARSAPPPRPRETIRPPPREH